MFVTVVILFILILITCCSVTKSCLTLRDPTNCSMPGFPVLHYLPEFALTHVHWVSDAIQPFHPRSSPSPLSQHQGLSNESDLHFRWLKYWSFSFSISPSNEYLGLISFTIDWFDLAVHFHNYSHNAVVFFVCVPYDPSWFTGYFI